MCQCILCDCWWCHWCEVCCAGCHVAYCLCSCWMCKDESLEQFDGECCHCCDGCVGWGGNLCCYGDVMCAPDYLIRYSMYLTQHDIKVDNQGTGNDLNKYWFCPPSNKTLHIYQFILFLLCLFFSASSALSLLLCLFCSVSSSVRIVKSIESLDWKNKMTIWYSFSPVSGSFQFLVDWVQ